MLRLFSICFICTAPQASSFKCKPCMNKIDFFNYLFTFRKSLGTYVDDLSLAIRKNSEQKGSSAAHGRVELLLCALVGLVINQRDTVIG